MTQMQAAMVQAVADMQLGLRLRLTGDDFKETCIAAFRIARLLGHDCDEGCSGCFECYRATGETVCSRTCKHADPAEVI